ncbi:uncharacterized membrane protein (DUF106 family) [Paenibacillus sp. SORGH_AS306]|nr:uncharacterized membrane protein (DUF106 family) [Paenibacillus sp. SORGH_AS_0306]MDR6110402.1 uncharacterized membrane protein (DUF106 family) [Paenibacillus sp. SORGH_AS_0338]
MLTRFSLEVNDFGSFLDHLKELQQDNMNSLMNVVLQFLLNVIQAHFMIITVLILIVILGIYFIFNAKKIFRKFTIRR